MYLSPSQLEILKTQNHSSSLKMSIYKPPILLACRVNDPLITRGARSITFDTVSAGGYANVYANAIMYIGTSVGAMDKGRIRVRSITASTITVAENSDIDWTDNLYLTIVDFIEISAIYPRIIKDPANDENVIFYKDYDVAYTNQNSVLGTFICMGSHRAADLENGSVQLYWTSSGTFNVKGDALTYLWEFGGVASGTSTVADPGYVTYTTPGEYKTKLTVTNSSGGTDISYRYVSIHSPAHPSILRWEMGTLSGSRDAGGYTTSMKVFESISDIHPNALVVIYSDDWYGTNHISLGGNQVNNSKTFFVGYIIENSIKYNYAAGYAEFNVGSPTEIMKLAEGFSISVESAITASTWFQIDDMDTAKAIYHYLKTHSTIPCVTDFRYVADNRLVQYFDSDRNSLFDAIDTFLKNGMIGDIVSDRQGTIWAEINPSAIDNAFTAIPPVLTLEKRDWMGTPNIPQSRDRKTSFIEMGGVAYYGATSNTFTALLSNAPGTAPSYQGKTESMEGLILVDQTQLNWLSGNYLEYQNATYPDNSMDFVGNYRNLDIAPVESVIMSLNQDDTFSGIQFSSIPFHITSMDWTYNSLQESLLPKINFHEITEGLYGETVIIPPTPPDDGYSYPDYGDFNFEKFPFNPIVIPPIIIPEVGGQTTSVAYDLVKGLFYTNDFESINPTWYPNNSGLSSGTYLLIDQIILPNDGGVYAIVKGDSYPAVVGIWYAPTPDATYTQILTRQMICDLWHGAPVIDITTGGWQYARIGGVGYDPTTSSTLLININNSSGFGNGAMLIGDSSGNFKLSDPTAVDSAAMDYKVRSSVSYGGGNWFAVGGANLMKLTKDGVYIPPLLGVQDWSKWTHTRIDDSDSLYMFYAYGGAGGICPISGNGTTVGTVIDASGSVNSLATDDTGQYLMIGAGTVIRKSNDYFATWQQITDFPPDFYQIVGAARQPVFCFDSNKWAIVGKYQGINYLGTRNNIIFTSDYGTTWESKMGNLVSYLLPSGTVDGYNFDMIVSRAKI